MRSNLVRVGIHFGEVCCFDELPEMVQKGGKIVSKSGFVEKMLTFSC